MNRTVALGLVGALLLTASAAAQRAAVIQSDGRCVLGDLTTGGWRFQSGSSPSSYAIEYDIAGELWTVDSSEDCWRYDVRTRRWVRTVNLRTVNRLREDGFVKDMAWCPVRQSMQMLWLRSSPLPGFAVWDVDMSTGRIVESREISADSLPITGAFALAADAQGTLWMNTTYPPALWTLEPWSGGYTMVERAAWPSNMQSVHGLAIDWRRDGAMYVCSFGGEFVELGPDLQPARMFRTASSRPEDIAIAPCLADVATDGFVDFFDYDRFVELFEEGNPLADLTADGFVDFHDYSAMVEAFESGC